MTQSRHPKGSPWGGRFKNSASRSVDPKGGRAATEAALAAGLVSSDQDSPGDSPADPETPHWLEIPEERRKALLAETDSYLAELRAQVGEPSNKHKRRAAALAQSLKQD
ncbi:hypothetical protein [Candidatus Poriferisodalis sp.]|uniref:hypothetical protein n=1 Tax=Candidatus Poriferisodalis sp. TaxID=3101277 RepID=UPI003B5A4C19